MNPSWRIVLMFLFLMPLRNSVSGQLPGDFDGNLVINAADFDYFWDCYECGDIRLNLNGNSVVGNDDFQILVERLAGTYWGDANVDGEFNSSDLIAVFQAGKFENEQNDARWSEGDWNGDRQFNSGDFVLAFSGGGYEIGRRPQPTIIGDFDHDGLLEIDDINVLLRHVAAKSGDAYDLNSDGQVDFDDIQTWIVDLKNTWMGDANLDGEFTSSDFVLIFQGGKFEQDVEALWHEGDWNGDLRFNPGDLVAAFVNCGYEGCGHGPRPIEALVPEPVLTNGAILLGLLIFSRVHSSSRHVNPPTSLG